MKKMSLILAAILILFTIGCATESNTALASTQTQAYTRVYTGERSPIIVGLFENRSDYMRGIFSDGEDRLGGQAKTILMGHLAQTNRFTVLDRDNMEVAVREAELSGQSRQLIGANLIITGAVSEFGRRETGDRQFFGLLGSGRTQTAYSRVTLNVVDITTGAVIYSVQGAGEYALSNREVVGFGGTAGYDATLNGKVLDLAIREAVDRLAEAIDAGAIRVR